MQAYCTYLQPDNKGWDVLEVGIDGDERPGGNYKYFGIGNNYRTLDFLERLYPDYVADICDTKMEGGKWDLVILSQTIEHVKEPSRAVTECHRLLKKGGYLILDCPFNYPYHGIPDYDDYHRFTHKGLALLLEQAGFKVLLNNIYEEVLSSALAIK
jgi:SAM-dependent methyltransferase